MQNINFVGTWKLLSAIARNPNEDTVYPFGENPFGRLMYDTNGNVSVFISGDSCLSWANGNTKDPACLTGIGDSYGPELAVYGCPWR